MLEIPKTKFIMEDSSFEKPRSISTCIQIFIFANKPPSNQRDKQTFFRFLLNGKVDKIKCTVMINDYSK